MSTAAEQASGQKTVRIGLVGVGNMGQAAHLRNYAAIDGCQVVALAEIRPQLARAVADRFGVPRVYASHEEMLAKEQLNGLVASQPFHRHAALLPELYPHVKFLFTEKPLAISVAAGQKLADLARDAGCTHMVGYHKRSDPAVEYARGIIDEWKTSGRMGRMKYVRILMPAGDWIAEGFLGLVRGEKAVGGLPGEPPPADMDEATAKEYVAFVNYYIHQVNLMRHLLGEPYRATFADASGVLLAVRGESGTCGVIEMSPYRTTVEWEESALVAFEKGYVKIELPAPLAVNRCGRVEVYADPGDGQPPLRTTPTLPWVHAMRNQAIHFVNVCRGRETPPCDAAEAVEDLRVARDYIRLRYGK
ncbi:MAG: Inositol 2-dehydrogenase/D-chiro-inositol 3-dehydrogenase [Phycisphaerae bacterium]|nr:Inositol 2-dehydrogenase/D-chiro-inositol 3-dehydrogenase [Phycisphaerae bacterium]